VVECGYQNRTNDIPRGVELCRNRAFNAKDFFANSSRYLKSQSIRVLRRRPVYSAKLYNGQNKTFSSGAGQATRLRNINNARNTIGADRGMNERKFHTCSAPAIRDYDQDAMHVRTLVSNPDHQFDQWPWLFASNDVLQV